MKVHQILRKIRRDKDLTQQNVADALSIDITTYHRYEKDGGTIQISILEKIAEVFEMTIGELFAYGNEDNLDMVTEPNFGYTMQKKVSISVELDGTKQTLENWFGLLKQFNKTISEA